MFGMRGNVYRTTGSRRDVAEGRDGTTASLMSGRQLADGRILLVGNVGLLARSRRRRPDRRAALVAREPRFRVADRNTRPGCCSPARAA